MKYKSFAVTYADDSAKKTNCENYFLNGFCKDNPREATQSDSSVVCDGRGLYAVASGGKSEESGEDAAYISVDLLRDFIKSDFASANKEYFELANERIMGRMFQSGGKKAAADIAILSINKDFARVYSIGDVDVFMCSGSSAVKISGKPDKTVSVSRESIDENGSFRINTENRATAEYLGMSAEKYEIYPFVSKRMKVRKDDLFLICSRGVSEKLGAAGIERIMANNRMKSEEKISAVISRASENGCENCTAELICCKGRGFGLRSRGFRVFAALAVLALLGTGIYAARDAVFGGVSALYNTCRSFIVSRNEKTDSETRTWTPMRKPEEAEVQQPETQQTPEQPAETQPVQPEAQQQQPEAATNSERTRTQTGQTRPNPIVENPVVKPQTPQPQTPVQTPQYEEPAEEEPVIRNGNAVTEGGTSGGRDVELPIDFGY